VEFKGQKIWALSSDEGALVLEIRGAAKRSSNEGKDDKTSMPKKCFGAHSHENGSLRERFHGGGGTKQRSSWTVMRKM